jgi:hypothetical protein
MHAKFWLERLEGRGHSKDLDLCERIILTGWESCTVQSTQSLKGVLRATSYGCIILPQTDGSTNNSCRH